jgi:hypothetical protein
VVEEAGVPGENHRVEQELVTLPEHLSLPRFLVRFVYSIFSFMCMYCKSLLVRFSSFFTPLCCLSCDLSILISPLVSSISSYCSSVTAIFQLYIMVTSFSGGRSRSTRREPPTMGKQLVNLITCESSAPF